MAAPSFAGSIGFCPPPATSDLPTKTTFASRYHKPISPKVSATKIRVSGAIASPALRIVGWALACFASAAISRPRRALRGAMMVRRSGKRARRMASAARQISSSPSCVEAATHVGRAPTCAVSCASLSGAAGGGATSYFRLPATFTRGAPSVAKRAASAAPCANTVSKAPRIFVAIPRASSQRP